MDDKYHRESDRTHLVHALDRLVGLGGDLISSDIVAHLVQRAVHNEQRLHEREDQIVDPKRELLPAPRVLRDLHQRHFLKFELQQGDDNHARH